MFLGNIVRMWQPFNGLQVYPAGVGKATEQEFVNVKGALDRFQGIDSASLCNLSGRYDNPMSTVFLAPIYCYKIRAQYILLQNLLPSH
jgi:hypothetical protein